MNATKILWGQVLVVSFVAVAFLGGATEWVAWHLAFQSQLGRPWFEVFGWPLYQPQTFFWWWFAYDAYARDIFVEGAYIAASGGIAAVIVAIAISVWLAREINRVTTYGSARWAETREICEAGLLGRDGVLLGRWRDHYLRHVGPEHVLCFAPTRSGKRVGLVVPTLLAWSGSAIVHDIKGENWTSTLRHAVPDARSLRAADDHLTEEQGGLLAHIFRRELRQCPEFREAPDRGGGYPSMSNLRGR